MGIITIPLGSMYRRVFAHRAAPFPHANKSRLEFRGREVGTESPGRQDSASRFRITPRRAEGLPGQCA